MKVISVDSGRHAVKSMYGDKRALFPSVVSHGREFKMDVDLNNKDYLWVNYDESEYFVGELAIKQLAGIQERAREKSNEYNKLLVLTAISLYVDQKDPVVLLTNIPARDWAKQRGEVKEVFLGEYMITHRAGIRQGIAVKFRIDKTYPLPEGAAAFHGYVYDENLNIRHPEFLKGNALVLDWGDETVNYVMMSNGEYVDQYCGSLDLGLHVAHAQLQKLIEEEGGEITQAELAQHIIMDTPVYIGKRDFDIRLHAIQEYGRLSEQVINQLTGRVPFNRVRNILNVGGGGNSLNRTIQNKLGDLCNVYSSSEGQWLNCIGQRIMYKMFTEGR
jgi:hypothetical protein